MHICVCTHVCGCVYGKKDSSLRHTEPAPCLRWRHDLEAFLSPPKQRPLSSLPLASSTMFPASCIQHRVPCLLHPVLCSLPLASSTMFPASCIQRMLPHKGVQNSCGYQREQRLPFQSFRKAMEEVYQELLTCLCWVKVISSQGNLTQENNPMYKPIFLYKLSIPPYH